MDHGTGTTSAPRRPGAVQILVQPGAAAVLDLAPTDPQTAPELSVVMPCLNEAKTLPVCIAKARECLARHGVAAEIVIADNGSTDGSQEIARAHGARVVDVPTRGYGAALALVLTALLIAVVWLYVRRASRDLDR